MQTWDSTRHPRYECSGIQDATVPVILAEMFPINLRCTVLSVLYATAASLAAGLTPLLSLMLLRSTNQSVAPTLLIIVLIALVWGVMRVKYLKEKKMGAISRETLDTQRGCIPSNCLDVFNNHRPFGSQPN